MRRRLYSRSQPRTTKRDDKILGLILMLRVKKSIDFSSYLSKPQLVILVERILITHLMENSQRDNVKGRSKINNCTFKLEIIAHG
jgi:hypothetical protein